MSNDENAAPAIMSKDAATRLAAISHRHGGSPKPLEVVSGEAKFPPLGKFKIKQDPLFDTPPKEK